MEKHECLKYRMPGTGGELSGLLLYLPTWYQDWDAWHSGSTGMQTCGISTCWNLCRELKFDDMMLVTGRLENGQGKPLWGINEIDTWRWRRIQVSEDEGEDSRQS